MSQIQEHYKKSFDNYVSYKAGVLILQDATVNDAKQLMESGFYLQETRPNGQSIFTKAFS